MVKKKLWQVILVMVLAGLMVATVVAPAGAAKPLPAPPTEGTPSADLKQANLDQIRSLESGTMSMESDYLIEFWGSGIGNAGVGLVNITGYTQTNIIVDYLDVMVVLQRWTGSTWLDITYVQNSDYDDWDVSTGTGLSVLRGYYYRVRSSHYAQEGTQTDVTTNYTPYIYVD